MVTARKARPAPPPPPPPSPARTLVLDNGAYALKAGFATAADDDDPGGPADAPQLVVPNCLVRDRQRKVYIGPEIPARCRDFGEAAFRRPVEKGYVVNWEAQRAIWQAIGVGSGGGGGGGNEALEADGAAAAVDGLLRCDPAECRLVLTEQPNALPALQANCDQMVFEEFGFASYYRGPAAQFVSYLDLDAAAAEATTPPATTPCGAAEIRLVVDSGYSFTTVTPVLHGRPVPRAVRRLDVGGKLLTNALTKLLSMRHYDMRHDTHIVNEIKEAACYVSLDFAADLDKAWRGPRGDPAHLDVFRAGSAGIAKEYVLPDYQTRLHGLLRDYDPAVAAARARRARRGAAAAAAAATGAAAADDDALADEDVLVLRNERFVVPELLFHPTDVGLPQPGLADVVAQSIACLPVGLWPALLANIVVVGGNAELPGLVQRLQQEVQARMPDDLVVRVTRPADPITCAWRGAARFATLPANAAVVGAAAVTRQEYEEHGAGWVARKFAAGLGLD